MSVQLALLAIVAGAISVASPCVVPLLPAYVGVLASSSDHGPDSRLRLLRPALAFVAGFTVVFVALGAVASTVGQLLRGRVDPLTRIAGVVMLGMGAAIALGSSHRWRSTGLAVAVASVAPRVPTSRTMALGAAVGIGWTPCIGPVLTSVLALSASTQTVYQGALALVLYSAGLAIPFVALALGFDRSTRLRRSLQHHARGVERCGGVLLMIVGIGYLTGWWTTVWSGVQGWVAKTGWPPL